MKFNSHKMITIFWLGSLGREPSRKRRHTLLTYFQNVIRIVQASELKKTYQLRGLADETELFKQTINMERNTDTQFEDHWFRDCQKHPLDSGYLAPKRLRTFTLIHLFLFEIEHGGD